ncbi:MAG: hypothetical protein P9L94_07065 [Candidatus Hinthialibacter antarcticus]|nr:hypothetical protein [Candidatus Hinthialibacter antarcticus]
MKLSYAFIILLLCGCSANSTRGYFDSQGVYNEVIVDKNETIPEPSNDEAVIVVICDGSVSTDAPKGVSVYANGQLRGTVASKSFTYFTVIPSETTIQCDHRFLSSIQLQLTTNPNQINYLYLDTKFENWGSKFTLEKISPEEGEEIIERIRSGRGGKSKASRSGGKS